MQESCQKQRPSKFPTRADFERTLGLSFVAIPLHQPGAMRGEARPSGALDSGRKCGRPGNGASPKSSRAKRMEALPCLAWPCIRMPVPIPPCPRAPTDSVQVRLQAMLGPHSAALRLISSPPTSSGCDLALASSPQERLLSTAHSSDSARGPELRVEEKAQRPTDRHPEFPMEVRAEIAIPGISSSGDCDLNVSGRTQPMSLANEGQALTKEV